MSSRDVLREVARRAMEGRGFLPDFSPAASAEASSAAAAPPDPLLEDLRGALWASIDNDDSLDLDQLSVAEPTGGGTVRVQVAVADVDAVVRTGSAVDGHARANTTSVYTAAEVFPMLPERLSTDLTSLAEGRDRVAVVVWMDVGPDGSVGDSGLKRALVRNQAKLAYGSVGAWLEGSAPPPPRVAAVPGMAEQLRLQDRVARAMRGLRHAHGALGLETVEPLAVFEGEEVKDLRPQARNLATDLIEDLMVAANGATARFLDRAGFPSLRRVLRAPERWDRIVAVARSLGEGLPPAPDARALEAFLARRRTADPARFPDLSLSVVKLLGKGEYALEFPGRPPDGHFALAVSDYTHSTAPNRRYADVVTQRLAKAALTGGGVPYAEADLADLARHCTEREDAAAKVERQVRKSAAALLLAGRRGAAFDAVVTGASEKGTWVRVLGPAVEGKLVQGFHGLDVGDRVRVVLVHTDVERGYVDFRRAGEGE
ncbi:MAG TPA: RNB domain-containing ribonuclease [Anaeromyxobacteraceae bacterium]|nr:RNB domain-containing ribonuclease [Anaeromyxobacteraceae bacterium]